MYYRQSCMWVLAGLALRALITTLGLALLGWLFQELLIAAAGIASLVLMGTVWLRWQLFRWRRW